MQSHSIRTMALWQPYLLRLFKVPCAGDGTVLFSFLYSVVRVSPCVFLTATLDR